MTSFRLYTDILGADTNAAIYRVAVSEQHHFQQSRLAPGRVDLRTRASTVVYDDRLTEFAPVVQAAVYARLAEALPALGIPEFEPGTFEIQMTSHNDGEFFRQHTDSASAATASRTVTFIYYFHGEPKGFTGGELVLFGPDGREEVIEPRNDSMVVFDARTSHEVRPVSCPSRRFEDGRFSLNGWVHRRNAGARPSSFFDQKIFAPVEQWWARRATAAHPADRRSTVAPPARRGTVAASPAGPGHLRGLLTLYGDLHRHGRNPDVIDVRPGLSGDEFFEEYYCRNRPVLLPGMLAGSPAVATWSPAYFARHHGHVEVEITSGRHGNPAYESRFRDTVQTVTIEELTRRLAATTESNDFYLVARNYFLDNPQLAPLRDDLRPPADIIDDADRSRGAAKLWFGPKGTVTPLHFDEHSILFAQVYGRKRFKLIPSFDYPRMYVRDTYYSEVDPEQVDARRHPLFTGATVMDVVVEPGDGLFLPAGWWHWVRSLSVAISVTFSSFLVAGRNTRLSAQ